MKPSWGSHGPLARGPRGLSMSTSRSLGPWADFYGRTVGDAWDQRVVFQFPTMSGSPKTFWVHERVLPALQLASTISRLRSASTHLHGSHRRLSTMGALHHPAGAGVLVPCCGRRARHQLVDKPLLGRQRPHHPDMPEWFVEAWRSAGWC